ncbi:choline/ethanolamine transporter flvcr2a-like isoform X2 [Littorina saxatilis]|uniref:choline/ethanolamine transporter flvcr2a-like isoform X2 n=1 Tax=Littorina saxatilis TaxID=31220 RepID=UPI0038B61DA8
MASTKYTKVDNQADGQEVILGYGATKSRDQEASAEENKRTDEAVHVYPRRWLMLGLFCLYSFSNAVQWIHLNIIANVLDRYYNASLPTDGYERANAIDWLSMVFMLAYVPLIFPATWLLDKKGLRVCMVAGCFLNALAAWLKCASVGENLFGVLMVAQTVAAISQIWVLGIPARLAAVWFGPNEVSTATSLGVFGNQIGIAVGFLTPPELVPNSADLDTIGTHLRNMFYGTAAITTAIFFVNLFFFQKEPPCPPSRAQQQQLELEVNANYGKSLLKLFRNKGFFVLMISYGMNTGSFYAVSTLLNNIILEYYPGEEENAGRIGLTLVLTGILGAVAGGIWLDKTRTFKGTSLGIYLMTTASMAAFAFTLDLGHLWIVFLTAGLLGLTMTGYLPVGFEFAAELTFPESEGTSSGLLNASAQIFGIILTMGMRAMMQNISVLWANITVTIILFFGTIMTGFIHADYRRQAANKEVTERMTNLEIEVDQPTSNWVKHLTPLDTDTEINNQDGLKTHL